MSRDRPDCMDPGPGEGWVNGEGACNQRTYLPLVQRVGSYASAAATAAARCMYCMCVDARCLLPTYALPTYPAVEPRFPQFPLPLTASFTVTPPVCTHTYIHATLRQLYRPGTGQACKQGVQETTGHYLYAQRDHTW